VGDKITEILKREKKMIITPKQELEYQKCNECHICGGYITKKDIKVRDHDHINGLFRGCAHQSCNINFNHKDYKIPVFFHNLKGFDGHIIIQGLGRMNFKKINIIAQNFEKYMTISFGCLKFLDSFAFLASSLNSLVDNLPKSDFKHTLKDDTLNDEQKDLIIKKGVYPYEYMDCNERFDETRLPPIEAFYSKLSGCGIKQNEYEHAINVWNKFNIQNMGEYHDLYLKTDVLLLTDVFETFRAVAFNNYGLDPANGYLTLPSFSWDAMLFKTGVRLEQLTDINMYIFMERGIRGGVSMISHRYAEANNKYMKNYDETKESSYIMYWDANNLYGGAMSEKLPYGGFKWVDMTAEELISFDADGDNGVYVEVDLEYPIELHNSHNDYPLAPESKCVLKSDLSPYQLSQLEIMKKLKN
jgi:hypothetical protein